MNFQNINDKDKRFFITIRQNFLGFDQMFCVRVQPVPDGRAPVRQDPDPHPHHWHSF